MPVFALFLICFKLAIWLLKVAWRSVRMVLRAASWILATTAGLSWRFGAWMARVYKGRARRNSPKEVLSCAV